MVWKVCKYMCLWGARKPSTSCMFFLIVLFGRWLSVLWKGMVWYKIFYHKTMVYFIDIFHRNTIDGCDRDWESWNHNVNIYLMNIKTTQWYACSNDVLVRKLVSDSLFFYFAWCMCNFVAMAIQNLAKLKIQLHT